MKAREFAVKPEKPVNNERRVLRWLREQTVTLSVLKDTAEYVVRFPVLLRDLVSLYIVRTLTSRLRLSMT
jgi:hypothetical protein